MDRSGRTRFNSWKEIASYLTSSVRTVQRWEKAESLPVHRHAHARQDTVYAYQDEIDAWRADRDRQITRGSTPQSTEMAFLQAELASAAPWRRLPPADHRKGRSCGETTLLEHFTGEKMNFESCKRTSRPSNQVRVATMLAGRHVDAPESDTHGQPFYFWTFRAASAITAATSSG